jgi:hypothetical protein
MKLSEKIDQLKIQLVNEMEFNVTMLYFYDQVSQSPLFVQQSKRLKNKAHMTQLQAMTQAATENVLRLVDPAQGVQKLKVKFVDILTLERYQLNHGYYTYGPYGAVLFYFMDLQMGLASINNRVTGNDLTYFARIKAQEVTDRNKNLVFDRSGHKH